MKTKLLSPKIFSLCVFGLVWTASQCQALTIVVNNRYPRGQYLPGYGGKSLSFAAGMLDDGTGTPVTETELKALVRSAADWWQNIYGTTPGTLTVDWAALDPAYATAVASCKAQSISGGIITRGSIAIAASGCQFYVDNWPNDYDEFPPATDGSPWAWWTGARWIEVGRYTGVATSGAASKNELWTIVLHEMGHLLGFYNNSSCKYWAEAHTDHDIDIVTYGYPWNSWWPITYGTPNRDSQSHLDWINYFDMVGDTLMSGLSGGKLTGRRTFPCQADILCIGQLNNWTIFNWGPNFVDHWNGDW